MSQQRCLTTKINGTGSRPFDFLKIKSQCSSKHRFQHLFLFLFEPSRNHVSTNCCSPALQDGMMDEEEKLNMAAGAPVTSLQAQAIQAQTYVLPI